LSMYEKQSILLKHKNQSPSEVCVTDMLGSSWASAKKNHLTITNHTYCLGWLSRSFPFSFFLSPECLNLLFGFQGLGAVYGSCPLLLIVLLAPHFFIFFLLSFLHSWFIHGSKWANEWILINQLVPYPDPVKVMEVDKWSNSDQGRVNTRIFTGPNGERRTFLYGWWAVECPWIHWDLKEGSLPENEAVLAEQEANGRSRSGHGHWW
jgi:hypothetical protein